MTRTFLLLLHLHPGLCVCTRLRIHLRERRNEEKGSKSFSTAVVMKTVTGERGTSPIEVWSGKTEK